MSEDGFFTLRENIPACNCTTLDDSPVLLSSMPLQLAALNSGSNGNCYYVGDEHSAILIDAGLSLKETEKRLRTLQLDPQKIKALFISHEHHDHITGLPALSRQWGIPVYLTPGTQQNLPFQVSPEAAHPLKALVPVKMGNLQVVAFEKQLLRKDVSRRDVPGTLKKKNTG